MDAGGVSTALLTTVATIFVAELTDKDALFLLALATRTKPSLVFAAGSVAFTISTAVIVVVGSALIEVVPVYAIRLAGGTIMVGYAVFEYFRFASQEERVNAREASLLGRGGGAWAIFLPAVLTLVLLDLAGDATELLTVVLLARFQEALVVFAGAVIGLVAAVGVETALGRRLGALLSPRRLRFLTVAVFLVIGTTVIATTVLGA